MTALSAEDSSRSPGTVKARFATVSIPRKKIALLIKCTMRSNCTEPTKPAHGTHSASGRPRGTRSAIFRARCRCRPLGQGPKIGTIARYCGPNRFAGEQKPFSWHFSSRELNVHLHTREMNPSSLAHQLNLHSYIRETSFGAHENASSAPHEKFAAQTNGSSQRSLARN